MWKRKQTSISSFKATIWGGRVVSWFLCSKRVLSFFNWTIVEGRFSSWFSDKTRACKRDSWPTSAGISVKQLPPKYKTFNLLVRKKMMIKILNHQMTKQIYLWRRPMVLGINGIWLPPMYKNFSVSSSSSWSGNRVKELPLKLISFRVLQVPRFFGMPSSTKRLFFTMRDVRFLSKRTESGMEVRLFPETFSIFILVKNATESGRVVNLLWCKIIDS